VASYSRTEDGDRLRQMVRRKRGLLASNGRTVDGDGWRQMVRRRMEMRMEKAMA
jgi:hypothetical protein